MTQPRATSSGGTPDWASPTVATSTAPVAHLTADGFLDYLALAMKYKRALRNIINVLGPESICECGPDDEGCGLRDEATQALRFALRALDG